MPLIIGLLVTVIAVVILTKLRIGKGMQDAKLGYMSKEWLAEHNASSHSGSRQGHQ